jgi:hypothetical protein
MPATAYRYALMRVGYKPPFSVGDMQCNAEFWGGFPGVHSKLAVVFQGRVDKFEPLLFEIEGLESYMVCWLSKPTL